MLILKRASALEDHISKQFTALKRTEAVQVQTDPCLHTQCVWGLSETQTEAMGMNGSRSQMSREVGSFISKLDQVKEDVTEVGRQDFRNDINEEKE